MCLLVSQILDNITFFLKLFGVIGRSFDDFDHIMSWNRFMLALLRPYRYENVNADLASVAQSTLESSAPTLRTLSPKGTGLLATQSA